MRPLRSKTIARFDAIREQINSAIRSFFLWDELVSAVTLAGAAERVLSDLQPQDGIIGVDAYSIRSMINLYVKEGYHKDAAKAFRKDYDFFRHADRNVTQHSYELKESSVALLIFTSIVAFEFLKQKKTMEMRAFYWWFMAKNPHWLMPTAPGLAMVMKMKSEITGRSKREYFLAFVAASEGRIPKDIEFLLDEDTDHKSQMIVQLPSKL